MQANFDPYGRDVKLIERFLGARYIGRRYISFSELIDLGVVDNRATLTLWIHAGVFPRPIKLAGPTGKSLRWVAVEIAQLIATRCAERDEKLTAETEKGTLVGCPSDFDSQPVCSGRKAQAYAMWQETRPKTSAGHADPKGDGAVKGVNLRRCERGTLLAFFDLALDSGIILRGCTLHSSHGRHWVGLPAKPYKDVSGADTWAAIVDFRNRATRDNFQRQATAAALAALEASRDAGLAA